MGEHSGPPHVSHTQKTPRGIQNQHELILNGSDSLDLLRYSRLFPEILLPRRLPSQKAAPTQGTGIILTDISFRPVHFLSPKQAGLSFYQIIRVHGFHHSLHSIILLGHLFLDALETSPLLWLCTFFGLSARSMSGRFHFGWWSGLPQTLQLYNQDTWDIITVMKGGLKICPPIPYKFSLEGMDLQPFPPTPPNPCDLFLTSSVWQMWWCVTWETRS